MINLPDWVEAILDFCRIFLFDIGAPNADTDGKQTKHTRETNANVDILRADCYLGNAIGSNYVVQTLVPLVPGLLFGGLVVLPQQKYRALNTVGMSLVYFLFPFARR